MSQTCSGSFLLRMESKTQPKRTFLSVKEPRFTEDRDKGLSENTKSTWKREVFKRNFSQRGLGWAQEQRRSLSVETKKDDFKHVGEVKGDWIWGWMKMNVKMASTCISAFSITWRAGSWINRIKETTQN